MNVCTSRADNSYSSSQSTTAREFEERPVWGVLGRGVRQTAVVGSQKQLTKYFRELEVASQQHKKLAKSVLISFHARKP